MDLFIQLKNIGLVTWTEYLTMDRDLALAMLEGQNALISKVEAEQAKVNEKQKAERDRQERMNELDRMAQQYTRK